MTFWVFIWCCEPSWCLMFGRRRSRYLNSTVQNDWVGLTLLPHGYPMFLITELLNLLCWDSTANIHTMWHIANVVHWWRVVLMKWHMMMWHNDDVSRRVFPSWDLFWPRAWVLRWRHQSPWWNFLCEIYHDGSCVLLGVCFCLLTWLHYSSQRILSSSGLLLTWHLSFAPRRPYWGPQRLSLSSRRPSLDKRRLRVFCDGLVFFVTVCLDLVTTWSFSSVTDFQVNKQLERNYPMFV